jgi:hypothetical protein
LVLGLTFEGLARLFDAYQAFGMKPGAAMSGGTVALAVATGLQIGVTIAIRSGGDACAMHYALRARLAWERLAPFRLRRFLDASTDRLLLRRSAGTYRFTHRLMKEHFASLAEQPDTIGTRLQSQAEKQHGVRPAPRWPYLPTLVVVAVATVVISWIPLWHLGHDFGPSWLQPVAFETWLILAGFQVSAGLVRGARFLLDEAIFLLALLYVWLLTILQVFGSPGLASSVLQLAWPLLVTLSIWWMGSLRQRLGLLRGNLVASS